MDAAQVSKTCNAGIVSGRFGVIPQLATSVSTVSAVDFQFRLSSQKSPDAWASSRHWKLQSQVAFASSCSLSPPFHLNKDMESQEDTTPASTFLQLFLMSGSYDVSPMALRWESLSSPCHRIVERKSTAAKLLKVNSKIRQCFLGMKIGFHSTLSLCIMDSSRWPVGSCPQDLEHGGLKMTLTNVRCTVHIHLPDPEFHLMLLRIIDLTTAGRLKMLHGKESKGSFFRFLDSSNWNSGSLDF
jgi:hypothetical protein